jgi:hypothetical protein
MKPDKAIAQMTVTWLRVDNDSAVDAPAVRVRLMAVEPPEAAFDLPADLTWRGEPPEATAYDIPANSHAYAVVATESQLSPSGRVISGPLAPIFSRVPPDTPLRLTLEAWCLGRPLATTSFDIKLSVTSLSSERPGNLPAPPPTRAGIDVNRSRDVLVADNEAPNIAVDASERVGVIGNRAGPSTVIPGSQPSVTHSESQPKLVPNAELSNRCRELASDIFEFIGDRKQSDPSNVPHWIGQADASEEEKRDAFWQHNGRGMEFTNETMSRYNRRFMGRSLGLLDRAVALGWITDPGARFRFEHPTNPLGIEEVARTLATLGELATQ